MGKRVTVLGRKITTWSIANNINDRVLQLRRIHHRLRKNYLELNEYQERRILKFIEEKDYLSLKLYLDRIIVHSDDIEAMNLRQLQKKARGLHIPKWSYLKKEELKEKIYEQEDRPQSTKQKRTLDLPENASGFHEENGA